MTLRAVPVTLKAANSFVAELHRTHEPARGCKFVVALGDESGRVVGVAIVGRGAKNDPVDTLTITRCCTDGTHNACSKLYGIARRVAGILGYRVKTFIEEHQSGASLRAAGFVKDGVTRGGSWNRADRPRIDKAPTGRKQRWLGAA